MRTNRSGGDVGTSPGINPITPYTTAALDYRASWIAGEMMKKTAVSTCEPAHEELAEHLACRPWTHARTR